MRFAIIITGLFIVVSPSNAQPAPDVSACAAKKDDRDRLACFDTATKAAEKAVSGPESTKTKDIIKPATPSDYKVVATEDLSVAPGKYDGKQIEMRRMRCFHADKDEYRCTGGGGPSLMIMTPRITPEAARAQIEDKCGELKNMTSPLCQKTIRFTPAAHDSDTISGYQNRTIVVTREIEIVDTK